MRVVVDTGRCCGSGNCVRILPSVFDQDEDQGLVVLREPEPSDELAPAVYEAVELCPAGAIAVR